MNKYYDTNIFSALFNQIIAIKIMGGEIPKAKPKKFHALGEKYAKK